MVRLWVSRYLASTTTTVLGMKDRISVEHVLYTSVSTASQPFAATGGSGCEIMNLLAMQSSVVQL